MASRKSLKGWAAALLAAVSLGATDVAAQVVQPGEQSGVIEWAVWVDQDGCMHWWADGGLEGYMVQRRDPETGKPMCLSQNTCFLENSDTLFRTDSARLTPAAVTRLQQVFSQQDVFGYAVYGHTDSRASDRYNQRLSERRAKAVADVGRSVGAIIERQIGFGESRPVADNSTAAGRQQNRRVEIVCYTW